MKIAAAAVAAAMIVVPLGAGAVTLAPGSVSGTDVAATFPTDGSRAVVEFTVAPDFEAILGVSISGDATGEYSDFADPLLAVEFGLTSDPTADVSTSFTAPTDFLNPSSAAFEFAAYDLEEGETAYLIFEIADGFLWNDDEELLLSYAYSAELRPVSPTNPIPLPVPALLLLSGLGGITLLGLKKRV